MVPCLPGSQLEKGKCDYDTNCNWFCSINIPRAQNICKALPLCMAPYEDMTQPSVPCIKYRQKKHITISFIAIINVPHLIGKQQFI